MVKKGIIAINTLNLEFKKRNNFRWKLFTTHFQDIQNV